MLLTKELPKIAARVLHNTRCAPQNMKFKFELIASAYGAAAVAGDFEAWCIENVNEKIPYPITAYVKVVDSRLGSAPEESKADLKDPRIGELVSKSYELTGVLPSKTSVAEVLITYPLDEITAALVEYTETLAEKEMKGSMRAFWADGGAGAVILARRRRSEHGKR